MARAARPAAADVFPDISGEEPITDALALLKRDHRVIERLFGEFDEAVGQQLDPVARRICKMLTLHTKIEEEIFYPAARMVVDARLLDAALAEHVAAKERITRLEAMTSEHPEFTECMHELACEIDAHVAEEEGELFPLLAASQLDLQMLGVALAERKETLMEVMGLHEDDELRATAEPPGAGVAGHALR